MGLNFLMVLGNQPAALLAARTLSPARYAGALMPLIPPTIGQPTNALLGGVQKPIESVPEENIDPHGVPTNRMNGSVRLKGGPGLHLIGTPYVREELF